LIIRVVLCNVLEGETRKHKSFERLYIRDFGIAGARQSNPHDIAGATAEMIRL
jgi:hypothetical protein